MTPIDVSVAPMEGITTFPTRLWLHMASKPDAATTPFLRATKTHPTDDLPRLFAPELFELRGALPYALTPQLMACEGDNFLRAAALLPPEVAPSIELNCGCPSPNGAGRHAGSGILRDPVEFGRTIERLSPRLGAGRLAVKMRLGIEADAEFDDLLPQLTSQPLARLTVHGRTRADKYRGHARWHAVQLAARQTTVPTWASGDVYDAASLARLVAAAPRAKGVMVGRGLLHNPWVFEELRRGRQVQISAAALANALACYGMLHEVSITMPDKLITRVANGRIGAYCGVDPECWERLCVHLSGLLGTAPFALFGPEQIPAIPVSPTSFARVRYMWAHLRSSLPEPYRSPRLVRARSLTELLAGILAVPAAAALTLKPSWYDEPSRT